MSTENTLRYIKFDYQSQKDALQQRIRARYPKLWNDFLTGGFGTVIIDIVAWALATMAFLVNRQAGEQFITTMTVRESAVRLGALTGYQLRGPTAAVVSCEATLQTAQATQVVIQKNTLVRTSDSQSLPFEVVQDYTINAGELTPQTVMVTLDPSLAGAKVLATTCNVTNGSTNVDLSDSTIDLTQYVSAGQTFQVVGETATYTIEAIEAAPGAISNNRLIVSPSYTGTTTSVTAVIFDKRIQLIQGQTVTDTFTAPTSDTTSFGVKLSTSPVIDNSTSVTVNDEVWTKVSSLTLSGADDQVYQIRTFATGETIITFGDGTFGAKLPTDSVIAVTYRVGGGIQGNIELSTVSTSITGIIPSTYSPVTVLVTNTTSTGQGGRDAETLEEARVNIPYNTRTNDRAVTLDDYQTIATGFSDSVLGSVSYARASIRSENSLLEGNNVIIYAWTTGVSGGLVNLSPQLKQSLQTYMQTKAMATDLVQIYDGSSRPVPISLRFKTLQGFTVSDVQNSIDDTLKVTIQALRPGQALIYSDMLRKLDETYGVDSINMATPIADLTPSNSTELFTVLQSDYVYDVSRNGIGAPVTTDDDGTTSLYTSQLPVAPIQAWSIRLFLGPDELTVVPGATAGFAELYGDNLSASQEDLPDAIKLVDPEPAQKYKSTVNLLTGQVRLWLKGAPGDLTMKLNQVGGYTTERSVNVYIGYTGDNTQSKRREIRAALRTWSTGLPVGGAIYGTEISGIRASKSSIETVLSSVNGVSSVTRVALETPGNNAVRTLAQDYELLRLGNIVLNAQVD
jgi:hypothetical protein